MKEYTIANKISDIAKDLLELYEIEYSLIKPHVDKILDNNIQDTEYIENILDKLLSIAYEPSHKSFINLCIYLSTFDMNLATEYIELYNNLYDEEKKKTH